MREGSWTDLRATSAGATSRSPFDYLCRRGCADSDLLCSHWPPRTDAFVHWPSAYTGQQEGSGHQDREPLHLPAPQTTTNCLLLSHISFFPSCDSLCLCPLFFFCSFSFCLSFFSLFSLFPLSSHLTWSSSVVLNSSPSSVRGSTVLFPPRFHSFPYSSLQKIVLCEMRQSRLASSISESQRDCKEVVKMTPPLGNTRPY